MLHCLYWRYWVGRIQQGRFGGFGGSGFAGSAGMVVYYWVFLAPRCGLYCCVILVLVFRLAIFDCKRSSLLSLELEMSFRDWKILIADIVPLRTVQGSKVSR